MVKRPGERPANRILFLDFDGCLHPTLVGDAPIKTGHFGWLPVLSQALRGQEDVALVVHSTWRYTHDHDELRELLGPLKQRVAGVTPRGPRFDSILWWLYMNPGFTDYRILDDDASEFPDPLPPEVILCNPSTGVSAPEVLEAINAWLVRPAS